MSGFMSAKCNMARHEITVWMLHYGQNQAVHRVKITLLDLNNSVVALTGDLTANDNWLNSKHERDERLKFSEAPTLQPQ